jgi:RNA polymerase sigma-70 factor (ECF subfamily)
MNSRILAETPVYEASLDDFDAVYEAYYQDVYRTVRGMVLDEALAEDVTQNVFLKAFKRRSDYQPTGSLGGWLHRIAVNEAISTLRWHALQERVLATLQMRTPRSSVDSRIDDLLTQLLEQLNPGARAALILHYLHGYRYREIANMLGVPEGTVATRIANGLRRMKQLLDNE